jgi:cytochrome c
MKTGLRILAALAAAAMAGCGGGNTPDETGAIATVTAATLGVQTVLTPAEYLEQPRYATADASGGEQQAVFCRACHSLEKDGGDRIGPNLYGVIGRKAGSRAGFAYSRALSQADFAWTPAALDAWLADPARFLPGTRMAIPGLADARDRDNLIAYLLGTERPEPD